MDRSLWLKHVICEIAEFACEDLRRSTRAEDGPSLSPFENDRGLFRDCGLTEALSEANPYGLRPDDRQVLSRLALSLAIYDEAHTNPTLQPSQGDHTPARLVSQSEWQHVRAAAQAVLRHFKQAGVPDVPKMPIFADPHAAFPTHFRAA